MFVLYLPVCSHKCIVQDIPGFCFLISLPIFLCIDSNKELAFRAWMTVSFEGTRNNGIQVMLT